MTEKQLDDIKKLLILLIKIEFHKSSALICIENKDELMNELLEIMK